MSRGLENRRERAAIARRMRDNLDKVSSDNAKTERFAEDFVLHQALGVVVAAAGGGALAWYRGGMPAWWQLMALGAVALGAPLVPWLRKRRAQRDR